MRTALKNNKQESNLPQTVTWQPRNATKKTTGSLKPFSQNVPCQFQFFVQPGVLNRSLSGLLLPVLLELPGFLVAAAADPHRVVPAAGGHGAALLRAVVAHALATGATVVDGETRGELPLALVAGVDVLIWDPVGRASCVLHQAWTQRKGSSSCC